MDLKKVITQVNNILIVTTALLLTVIMLGVYLMLPSKPNKTEVKVVPDMSREQLLQRGAYLVNTSACHDCHSPKVMTPLGPEPDPERLLSGYPSDKPMPTIKTETLNDWVLFNQDLTSAVGPWGVSFAANITADETGIGNWTEEQFLTALKKGKYKGLEGSRSLLPPMPWQVYRNMNDTDLKAIFAYLKSTKPVRNIVPSPVSPDQIGTDSRP